MADVYRVLQRDKFLREFFSRDVRPDGRNFENFRWTVVNPGSIKTADGSCIVKIGHTKVVCGIKAELTAPSPEKPNEGFVVTNLEIPPLCSSQFRPGAPGGMAQSCNQLVANIFEDSQCVNLEDLCIVKDKLVWVLYCDMVCMDYDGSIIDACLMSLITAFKTVKLPEVKYNAATEMCVVHENKKRRGISVKTIPIATTFTFFEGNIMLADPTAEEEAVCGSALGGTTIVRGINYNKEESKAHTDVLKGIHRLGGPPLPPATLQKAISLATKRTKQIQELIYTALQQMNDDD